MRQLAESEQKYLYILYIMYASIGKKKCNPCNILENLLDEKGIRYHYLDMLEMPHKTMTYLKIYCRYTAYTLLYYILHRLHSLYYILIVRRLLLFILYHKYKNSKFVRAVKNVFEAKIISRTRELTLLTLRTNSRYARYSRTYSTYSRTPTLLNSQFNLFTNPTTLLTSSTY